MHVDETPVKTTERPNDKEELETSSHSTFNACIRTYSNDRTTVLTVNPRKTEEGVIEDNILTQFQGIVSQDHEAKFYNFGVQHATCESAFEPRICSCVWKNIKLKSPVFPKILTFRSTITKPNATFAITNLNRKLQAGFAQKAARKILQKHHQLSVLL
jgi:hypothetical protein